MTTDTLIKKVREEHGSLDAKSEQAVVMAMKIIENAKSAPIPPPEGNFVGQNITLEEYAVLPREEKCRYHGEAEELNQRWVEAQLQQHQAKWLMVVDGKVVQHGATLKNFPDHDELIALCKGTGKYPFAFFSPRVFAIEEQLTTTWHITNAPNDFYPALSIKLSELNRHFETAAGLDTGAIDCYAALELLETNGIVKARDGDVVRIARHLGQSYVYFALPALLELVDKPGKTGQCLTTIFCVADWRNSPFTAINPTRTFLLGREILLELQPRLVLDFAARRTEVQYTEAAS